MGLRYTIMTQNSQVHREQTDVEVRTSWDDCMRVQQNCDVSRPYSCNVCISEIPAQRLAAVHAVYDAVYTRVYK